VKPLVRLAGSVGHPQSEPDVAHDARDDQAVARCGLHVAVDGGGARDRIEHLSGELRLDERSEERSRCDACRRAHPAWREVVDLEEALYEAAAKDEPNVRPRRGVLDSQGRPRDSASSAVANVANHSFCGPPMLVHVPRNRSDGPRGREGNCRERGIAESSRQRAYTRHARSVAARQNDRVAPTPCDVDGRSFEVAKVMRLVNTRSTSLRRARERIENTIGALQAPRVAIENDVDAPSHGAPGVALEVETSYVPVVPHVPYRAVEPTFVTSLCWRSWALILATCILCNLGCASSPSMHAAEGGDRALLRDLIDKREKAGTLSNGEATSLARAVAAREVRVATASDAVLRVRDIQSCARELDDALAARMRTRDAAGAQAALARIESGHLDVDGVRAMLSEPSAEWRAVGTRALVRSKDRQSRVLALLDPDPGVRRQAARAARDAADVSDVDVLAEAARLDPEPIVRTEAVRAIAVLPPLPGSRTARLLRDLWTGGDSGLREDIARAWSSASVWPAGGRDALRDVIASEHGPGVVEAEAVVLARREPVDEISNLAAAAMARAIAVGSKLTRIQALVEAPLDRADLLAAVKAAAEDDDREVRIAALGRLAQHDPSAVQQLESLARPGQRLGSRAQFALALAGDRRVQGWIEGDLEALAPEARLAAATALSALGVAARSAPLLADEDPSVRERAACTIVMAGRVAR